MPLQKNGAGTLTIVIPTYNSRQDLPACIASIVASLGSLLGDCASILVQDGDSTDGTQAYVDNLGIDGIIISSEPDLGVYDAMNKAVAKATSEWVYFMGADDKLLPGFKNILPQLTDTLCVYYANVLYSSDMRKYDGRFQPLKLVYRNICHQCLFYPTKMLKTNPYSLRYPIKSDWVKNIELMSTTTFVYIDQEVAIYNDTSGLSFDHEDAQFIKDKGQIFLKNFGWPFKLLCLTAPVATSFYQKFIRQTS